MRGGGGGEGRGRERRERERERKGERVGHQSVCKYIIMYSIHDIHVPHSRKIWRFGGLYILQPPN